MSIAVAVVVSVGIVAGVAAYGFTLLFVYYSNHPRRGY